VADLAQRVAYAQAARRVGTVLCGRWTIDRLVGIGGMAQVFAATHRNGRAVAIKILRPELAVEPLFVERFLREGYVANKVQHAGAVAILDDDLAPEGAPFLVMELLSGKTLRERLRESGPLPAAEAFRVADRILDVLAAAHERGIVHRDIKPDNVLVTDDGAVKVLDFGIARLREHLGPTDTQSGMTMGTIGYMPPEQARGIPGAIDARSDLWAVGATLLTLLTGRILHEADSTNQGLLLAMTEPVPPMSILEPGLPPEVCALLDRALAFEQPNRFADARVMQEAIRAVSESAPRDRSQHPLVAAPPPGRSGRASTGTVLGAVALVVGLALAFGLTWRRMAAATVTTSTSVSVESASPSAGDWSTTVSLAPEPSATTAEPAAVEASPRVDSGSASNHRDVPRAPPRPASSPRPATLTTSSAPAPGSAVPLDPLGPRL
jgi:serine/threonine-protein kinase